MFKKIFAALICTVFTAAMLCGCDERDDDFPTEMYYGQAMKEVNRKDIYLIYDGRYVSDDEMSALADYYISIQEKDYEKFASSQPKDYLEFLENENGMDIEVIVNREYSSTVDEIGEGFVFSQIEVTDCGDSKADMGLKDAMDTVDGIYSDMGKKEKFSDTVKEAKYVTFDVYADVGNSNFKMAAQTKYIFNCEDGIYIF